MLQQLVEQINEGFILNQMKIIQYQDKGLFNPVEFVDEIGSQ